MKKNTYKKEQKSQLIDEYEKNLLRLYGAIIGGKDLRKILGYRTADAFRQAVRRNQIPFPTFIPEGRKARAARSRDIAKWLVSIDESEGKNEI